MNELVKQRIALWFNNTIRIIVFAILAMVFNKWWIILFSALFLGYEKDKKGEGDHEKIH